MAETRGWGDEDFPRGSPKEPRISNTPQLRDARKEGMPNIWRAHEATQCPTECLADMRPQFLRGLQGGRPGARGTGSRGQPRISAFGGTAAGFAGGWERCQDFTLPDAFQLDLPPPHPRVSTAVRIRKDREVLSEVRERGNSQVVSPGEQRTMRRQSC